MCKFKKTETKQHNTMGSEIHRASFSETDFREFREHLRKETRLLAEWFSSSTFDDEAGMCGFELEGWLVDSNCNPAASNEEFLEKVNHHLVVPELSRYNFEINSTPHPPGGAMFRLMHEELASIWEHCSAIAATIGVKPMMIGILPTIDNRQLCLDNVSPLQRYSALNREILRSRQKKPLRIHIEGITETLDIVHHDVMAEAATTSLQIHFQTTPNLAVRHYNAAHLLSAPMVAATANAPYLFGKELWSETRIPLFEQAVSIPTFTDRHGNIISRVTFGRDYARHSLLEVFLENLDAFPILLPVVFDEDPGWMNHVRLHNGTIWRWNRPLIGMNKEGKPHLRIEHRVPSAGPSIPDSIANIAFFYGSMLFLLSEKEPLSTMLSFEDIRHNFYQAARYGLDARIRWLNGRTMSVQELITTLLLPGAYSALLAADVDPDDVRLYLDGIIRPRVTEKKTGAHWQTAFIRRHGPDFQAMTEHYYNCQKQHNPVHEWKVL
ncbi:hypothetical protein CR161_01810 [Prosthecochloris sp. ZM]|nr:hypothetical protein CR161_01810 [Prosthecochloris sp. ZM]